MFSCEICEILKTPFFTENLQRLLLKLSSISIQKFRLFPKISESLKSCRSTFSYSRSLACLNKSNFCLYCCDQHNSFRHSSGSLNRVIIVTNRVRTIINPIQDGLFRDFSRMEGGLFGPPSLKSTTHILQ